MKEQGGHKPASGCDKAADYVRCRRRPSPSSCRCLSSARSASQPRRQSRSESTGSCNQNIDADDPEWWHSDADDAEWWHFENETDTCREL